MLQNRKFIIVDPRDNVATAVVDLKSGDTYEINTRKIVVQNDIAFGHKFALSHIAEGGNVIKYGVPIGRATSPIGPGEHVHVHNVYDIVDEVRKN